MKSQIKKIVCLIACLCLVFSSLMVVSAAEANASISFADKAKRTVFNTNQQVWVDNGITVTNNKSTSTNNVADYANPARFYKNSEVIIAYTSAMTKIEITANSSTYATDLVDSLTDPQGTVIKNNSVVTIVPTTPVTSYTFKCSDAQIRVNSIKVYYESAGPVEPPFDPSTATPVEIVEEAYKLTGAETIDNVTLTGKITAINTPYDSGYKNITFTIAIEGTDKTMYCYRVTADEAKLETLAGLAVNDTVTLNGNIVVYSGKPQFAQGTKMTECVKGVTPVAPEDPKQIVDEAFALAAGGALPYEATLTGVVKSIDTEYSEQHKNITVTIEVEGTTGKKDIQCYRLKADEGADASTIAVGDTITVTGYIINYAASNKVQFNAGATFVPYVDNNNNNN
ncbi:MAG: hypothetical protein IKB86_08220, partial [Clostridia bacterium]|nr:hypothetical protein [Clostridia bacterium]